MHNVIGAIILGLAIIGAQVIEAQVYLSTHQVKAQKKSSVRKPRIQDVRPYRTHYTPVVSVVALAR